MVGYGRADHQSSDLTGAAFRIEGPIRAICAHDIDRTAETYKRIDDFAFTHTR